MCAKYLRNLTDFLFSDDEDGPCIGLCHHNKVMAMKDPNYKGHSHKSVRGVSDLIKTQFHEFF